MLAWLMHERCNVYRETELGTKAPSSVPLYILHLLCIIRYMELCTSLM